MNREEILAKSREGGNDEGLIAAENKGRKIGITAFCCVFIFITLFNLFHAQSNSAPMAMLWAFVAAEAYPKYKFTEKTGYLITAISGAIASVAFLASHVLTVLQ